VARRVLLGAPRRPGIHRALPRAPTRARFLVLARDRRVGEGYRPDRSGDAQYFDTLRLGRHWPVKPTNRELLHSRTQTCLSGPIQCDLHLRGGPLTGPRNSAIENVTSHFRMTRPRVKEEPRLTALLLPASSSNSDALFRSPPANACAPPSLPPCPPPPPNLRGPFPAPPRCA
jgi:hypothetical protein